MELKKARVQNFRSVEDSEEFTLEHSTCLVGKNEAGKTAILQALAGLNPHPATPFSYELERDYPKRFLNRYKERHGDREAVVVSSIWEISEAELDKLRGEFGADAIVGTTISVSRTYHSNGTSWTLPTDETKATEYLIANAGFSAPERSQVAAHTTLKSLVAKLTELAPSNVK